MTSPLQNKRPDYTAKVVVFKGIPDGMPNPKDDFIVEKRDVDKLSDGISGVSYRVIYLGLDPYLRDRMRPDHERDVRNYAPAYRLGEVMDTFSIGVVTDSNVGCFSKGDVVTGCLDMAGAGVMPSMYMQGAFFRKLENPLDLKVSYFLGPLGIAGKMAWIAYNAYLLPRLKQIAASRSTDDGTTAAIWVSSAGSCAGQILCQLLKNSEFSSHISIIGSTSSAEKGAKLIKMGACDSVFNYKYTPPPVALQERAPNGLDTYVDLVGGEQIDAALDALNRKGMVVHCGSSSCFNSIKSSSNREDHYDKVREKAASKDIVVHGKVWWNAPEMQRYLEDFDRLAKIIKDGEVKVNMVEYKGIDKVPEALCNVFKGVGFGRSVVKIGNL